jgi:hypothetical protein
MRAAAHDSTIEGDQPAARKSMDAPRIERVLVAYDGSDGARLEEDQSDLVVKGTRGLSAGKRWLVGSVSTKVLHHARYSVLVAR